MATKTTSKSATKAPAKSKRSKTLAASKTPKAAAKTTPKPKVVSTKATAATAAAPEKQAPAMDPLTKKELIERMVTESGMKKGEARRALEATMGAIATALREGRDMNLPPLGKVKIARSKETPNGKLVVLRAKLKEPGAASPKDPLAEAAE